MISPLRVILCTTFLGGVIGIPVAVTQKSAPAQEKKEEVKAGWKNLPKLDKECAGVALGDTAPKKPKLFLCLGGVKEDRNQQTTQKVAVYYSEDGTYTSENLRKVKYFFLMSQSKGQLYVQTTDASNDDSRVPIPWPSFFKNLQDESSSASSLNPENSCTLTNKGQDNSNTTYTLSCTQRPWTVEQGHNTFEIPKK